MSNYEQSNVGMGMVPCKKNCRCDDCEIDRLQFEINRLRALLEPLPPLIFHATTSIAIETAKEYLLEYAEEFMQEDPEIGMRCDPQNHEIFKWLSENLERIVPTKGGDT